MIQVLAAEQDRLLAMRNSILSGGLYSSCDQKDAAEKINCRWLDIGKRTSLPGG